MAIKCPSPGCEALFEWDWCQDTYWNPHNKEFHTVQDSETDRVCEFFCNECGLFVGSMCDGSVFHEDPSFDVDWEEHAKGEC